VTLGRVSVKLIVIVILSENCNVGIQHPVCGQNRCIANLMGFDGDGVGDVASVVWVATCLDGCRDAVWASRSGIAYATMVRAVSVFVARRSLSSSLVNGEIAAKLDGAIHVTNIQKRPLDALLKPELLCTKETANMSFRGSRVDYCRYCRFEAVCS
jgi:hypothetical protein